MSALGSSSATQTLILAAVAVVSVSGAVYTSGVFAPASLPQQLAPEAPAVAVAPVETPAQESDAPEVVAETPTIAPEETAPEETTPVEVAETPEAASVAVPGFDLVRMELDRSGLVAGHGEPGATVTILLDGDALSQVIVGTDGKFVSFIAMDPSNDPRVLSLLQQLDGEDVYSDATVIIAPSAPVVAAIETAPEETENVETAALSEEGTDTTSNAEETVVARDTTNTSQEVALIATEVATATPTQEVEDAVSETANVVVAGGTAFVSEELIEDAQDGGADLGENIVVAALDPEVTPTPSLSETTDAESSPTVDTTAAPASADSEETEQTEVAEDATPAAPATPVVIIADADGARVLQSPTAEVAPEVLASIAIDSISYSDEGAVQVAGRSPSGDFVRLYLDNTLSSEVRIAQSGLWEIELPDVAPGVYTMRVDQVSDAGEVVSRVETPFKREPSEKLVNSTKELVAKKVLAVTVQPGMTLWAISKENYGDGRLYVQVFEANKDRIRNPDLIYPGQVFTVPEN